ncbi:MAG: hypothetical protein WA639_10310 [Candidatus Acidiferrum sp.]
MKLTAILWAFSLFLCSFSIQQPPSMRATPSKPNPRLLLTMCGGDGIEAVIPEFPARDKIARIADVDLEAGFPTEEDGATFRFLRGKKEILRFVAKDLSAQSVWIAVDNGLGLGRTTGEAHIAITYSDGGAIGRFHVRVFLIDGHGVRDVSNSIDGAVADFKSRHYCKTRGNNVTALKWIRGGLLLTTEVYPTGDCGSDLGHLEGYLVSVPEGKILEHLTLHELKHYPGVCLMNDNEK